MLRAFVVTLRSAWCVWLQGLRSFCWHCFRRQKELSGAGLPAASRLGGMLCPQGKELPLWVLVTAGSVPQGGDGERFPGWALVVGSHCWTSLLQGVGGEGGGSQVMGREDASGLSALLRWVS